MGVSRTTTKKPRATTPAASGLTRLASPVKPAAVKATKKADKGLVSAVRRTRLVVRQAAQPLDRDLLAMGGLLLGVAAIGAAVLGGGIRHVFREGRP